MTDDALPDMLDASLFNATLPAHLAEVANSYLLSTNRGNAVIVISRMKDEGVVIGDDIVVTVTEIEGDEIRLHIERPRGIPVAKRVVGETVEQMAETSPSP